MNEEIHHLEQLADFYPKDAVKECTKYLKRYQNTHVKALLALSYTKLGNDAAIPLIQQLTALKSTDMHVLKVLGVCLRYQGHSESVPLLYEHCWKLNEEMATQYFMALIRSRNFKQQQLVSSYLYKLTNKPHYISWSGTVLYLQSQKANENEKLLLTLAQRTLDKLPSKSTHIQYIYCEILCKLKLYDQITKFKINNLDTDLQIINAYKQLDNIPFVISSMEEVITRDHSENWELLKEYAELLKTYNKQPIKMSHKSIPGHKNILLFQIYYNHLTNVDPSVPVNSYFNAYKHHPSLLKELKYIFTLGVNKSLLSPLLVIPDIPTTKADLVCYTNMCQLQYYHNKSNISSVSQYLALFAKFPATVKQANPVDDLLMIQVMDILDKNTPTSKLDALHILLLGLKHSKFNILFKLWAIELSSYFHHPMAITLYNELEIKNIQVDMLGTILLDKLNFMGLYKDAIKFSFKIRGLSLSNMMETPEMIAQAYLHESYINILEFNEFKHRIDHSISKYCAQTEAIRAYLFMPSDNDIRLTLRNMQSQILPIPSKIVDNRDISIYDGNVHLINYKTDLEWCVFWYSLYIGLLESESVAELRIKIKGVDCKEKVTQIYKQSLLQGLDTLEYKYKDHGNLN